MRSSACGLAAGFGLVLSLSLTLSASIPGATDQPEAGTGPVPALPRIVLVGDSIRLGYAPIVATLGSILERGQRAGLFRTNVDPLRFYVTLSGMGYYIVSNRFTLEATLGRDFSAASISCMTSSHPSPGYAPGASRASAASSSAVCTGLTR